MSALTRRSPAPPQQPGIENHSQHDCTPLEFRCLIQRPHGPLLASLRDPYGDEIHVRAIDALQAPDIAPRLTERAHRTLAMMLLYGDE